MKVELKEFSVRYVQYVNYFSQIVAWDDNNTKHMD